MAAVAGLVGLAAPFARWFSFDLSGGGFRITTSTTGWGSTSARSEQPILEVPGGAWDGWVLGGVPDGVVAAAVALLVLVVGARLAVGAGRSPRSQAWALVALGPVGLAWSVASWRQHTAQTEELEGFLRSLTPAGDLAMDPAVGPGLVVAAAAALVATGAGLVALTASEAVAPRPAGRVAPERPSAPDGTPVSTATPVAVDAPRHPADTRLSRILAAMAAVAAVVAAVAPSRTWLRLTGNPLGEPVPRLTLDTSGWGSATVSRRSGEAASGDWGRWLFGSVGDGVIASGLAVAAIALVLLVAARAELVRGGRRPALGPAVGLLAVSAAGAAWCLVSYRTQVAEVRRDVDLDVGVLSADSSFLSQGAEVSVGGGLFATGVAFGTLVVLALLVIGSLFVASPWPRTDSGDLLASPAPSPPSPPPVENGPIGPQPPATAPAPVRWAPEPPDPVADPAAPPAPPPHRHGERPLAVPRAVADSLPLPSRPPPPDAL